MFICSNLFFVHHSGFDTISASLTFSLLDISFPLIFAFLLCLFILNDVILCYIIFYWPGSDNAFCTVFSCTITFHVCTTIFGHFCIFITRLYLLYLHYVHWIFSQLKVVLWECFLSVCAYVVYEF